jgi:DNA polymerase-3 subunit beta
MLLSLLIIINVSFNRRYPNYEGYPKENPNKLMIDRSQFLSSVRRVAFSNKTTHQIRLKIAGAELNVSAEDIDLPNKERLTCDYQKTTCK